MDDSFGRGVGAEKIASGSSNVLAVTHSGAKIGHWQDNILGKTTFLATYVFISIEIHLLGCVSTLFIL